MSDLYSSSANYATSHHLQQQHQQLQQQQIQVQILPQDDNWGENNATAMTGDFSDFNDDMTEDGRSSHFNGRNTRDLVLPPASSYDPVLGSNMHQNNYNSNYNDFYFDSNQRKSLIGKLKEFSKYYFGYFCSFCIAFCSFMSPIIFMVLPRFNLNHQWQVSECGLECEGILIGLAFKLFILLLGAWAVFGRRPNASLPRNYEFKTVLLLLQCLITFAYWLFYFIRIIDARITDYHTILQFTVSFVDVLLFLYIVSVFIVELRHLRPEYVIKVIRSPDGESREYSLGRMSIQRAALFILEQYYKDFAVYNPWLDRAHRKRGIQLFQTEQSDKKRGKAHNVSQSTAFKSFNNGDTGDEKYNSDYYGNNLNPNNYDAEMDNITIKSAKKKKSSSRMNANNNTTNNNNNPNGSIVGGNFSANDRIFEEIEYERRLKKRRTRLATSCDEAFAHLRRVQGAENINSTNGSPTTAMDPYEAALTIFSSIARDLRRYLRFTRQQSYFTRESIIAHLANCISYDMSPRSFLERYLTPEPLVFNDKAMYESSSNEHKAQFSSIMSRNSTNGTINYHMANKKPLDQSWILICDTMLYQNVQDNLMFVLKQNEVSLMCTFKKMPRFNLIEDILDPMRNKFVLRLNSETTV